jgi:hypothetical protein
MRHYSHFALSRSDHQTSRLLERSAEVVKNKVPHQSSSSPVAGGMLAASITITSINLMEYGVTIAPFTQRLRLGSRQ